jgi:hypothetical protein
MEINGKTSVIDSDFRAGAIFYSLTNALLFSFAITNTVIYSLLVQKNNMLDGVNVMAMAIISGIVSFISGALLVYSIYKLVMVKYKRDRIQHELGISQEPDMNEKPFESIRDINKNLVSSPFSDLNKTFRPAKKQISTRGIF